MNLLLTNVPVRLNIGSVVRRFSSLADKEPVNDGISSLKIGVIGVPFSKGQTNEGVRKGPQVIREGGVLKELNALGHNVRDYGDITYKFSHDQVQNTSNSSHVKNMKDLEDVAACNREVSKKVQEILAEDSQVLVLGGDHSVCIGSADGFIQKYGDIGLIYVDAHADLNTADTSPSGNVHGMTVALLVKELYDYWPYLPGMDWQKPVLPVKNIAYIGLRSVDKYERVILDKFSIPAYGMAEVEKYGIDKVTEMVLDQVDPKGNRALQVSFDIDSLDVLEAPSTGCSVCGGLTLREGIHILEIVHQTGRMKVMDLVEVNPNIGSERDVKKTVDAALHLIKAAYGFSRLGNVPRHIKDIPTYNSFQPSK
ncbi:arginase-1-like isoform X1 [Macrosteles quadrilineatus]|uniref:arginase-1-like isoform X1 n=1 Tax=Macrosteles quadrilineatus TaxID=74068 RepID=UPI0023E34942|nr:arginase-1-like isoform X1 [Macrosteles quadrilineatus]